MTWLDNLREALTKYGGVLTVTPDQAKRLLSWEVESEYRDRMLRSQPRAYPESFRFYRGEYRNMWNDVLRGYERWCIDDKAARPTMALSDGTLVVCWRLAHDRSEPSNHVAFNRQGRIIAGGQLLIDIVMSDRPTDLRMVVDVDVEAEPMYSRRPLEYVI